MNEQSLIQRTDEWRAARCGSLGASAVHEIAARTKSGWSASRANRMAIIIVERLTGVPVETYQNQAMVHGIETEPEARAAYSFRTDTDVKEIGLVLHPTIKGTHASPDGLVGDDGVLELKCPQPAAHLAALLGEPIPDKYLVQMLWQMRCCDRSWCDYVSYSPQFPEHMRLFIRRIPRDAARITELEKLVSEFLAETDRKVEQLNALYAREEAA